MIFSRRKDQARTRRKDQARDCGPAIAEFWKWWPGVRAQVEKSIEGGWDDKLVRQMGKKVAAIHPDLQWEFAKGSASRHSLVVCPGGGSGPRAVAERWLAAAPRPDATWAYHSSRQADPDAFGNTLTIDGHTVLLDKIRYGVDVDTDRHQVDVVTFHPIFSVMTEQERLRVALLTLDWALGETGVELWVGAITASRTEPQRPHTVTQLRSAVTNLAQKVSDDTWAILTGEDPDGYSRLATVQVPLKPARWPRYDTHLRIEVTYRQVRDNGFPGEESLAALREFEDRLVAALGTDGALIAHETSQGRRTFHGYLDGLTRAADSVKRTVPRWPEGRTAMAVSFDPSWRAIDHLRA